MNRDSNGKLLSKHQYLSKEFQDIDLYFTLVSARDEGKISDEDLKQLQSIISEYDWAKEIDEAYNQYRNNQISKVDYMKIYVPILYRLQDKIDEFSKKGGLPEDTLDIDEHGLVLPEDISEYTRYLRLKMLEDKNQLSDIEKKELYEIISRNERAADLEIAKRLYDDNKISKDEYHAVYDKFKNEVKNAILEANKDREEKEAEEEKNTEDRYELPNEYKDYLKYLKLSILKDSKTISTTGQQELEEIIANNDMAKEIEEAKKALKNDKITKEELDEKLKKYREKINNAAIELTQKRNEVEEKNKKEYSDEELSKLEEDIINENNEIIEEEAIVNENNENIKDEDGFNPIKRDPYLDFIYNMFNGKKITKIDNSNLDKVELDVSKNDDTKTNHMDEYYEKEFAKEPVKKPETRPIIENPQDKMDEYYNKEFRVPVDEPKKEDNEKNTSQKEEKGNEEKEFKALAKYLKLRILRNRNGSLTDEEQKEYDKALEISERAKAIEEVEEHHVSKEKLEEFIYRHKRALLAYYTKVKEKDNAKKSNKDDDEEKYIPKYKNMDEYYAKRFSQEPVEKPETRPIIENPQDKMDEHYNREFRVPVDKQEEYIPKHAKVGEVVEGNPDYIPKHAKVEENEEYIPKHAKAGEVVEGNPDYIPKHAKAEEAVEENEEYIPKHAKAGEVVEGNPDYIPKHAKSNEVEFEEKNIIKIARDTIDNYNAYRNGLNKLGLSDINQLFDLITNYNIKTPEKDMNNVHKR